MEPESSLYNSHVPATCPYPEPARSSPCPSKTPYWIQITISQHIWNSSSTQMPSADGMNHIYPQPSNYSIEDNLGWESESANSDRSSSAFHLRPVHTRYTECKLTLGRSQWSRRLRRRSAVLRLLRLWVRVPPEGTHVCLLWLLCVVR